MARSWQPSAGEGGHEGGIVEAAKEDYGRMIEAKADLLGLQGEGHRK
jgi:hypothetical protein